MSQPSQSTQGTSSLPFAHALTEARQVIIQQQLRIKGDAEKLRAQQQTINDQAGAIVEHERKMREQADELTRLGEELKGTQDQLRDMTTAREHAEAVIDRQGQRLTGLQTTVAEMEQKLAGQAGQLSDLQARIESIQALLPTREDEEALSQLMELLNKRPASLRRPSEGTLHIADVVSEPEAEVHAKAA